MMRIFSYSPFGYEGNLISVEVDLRRGIPAVDIIGLADSSIKESRERMMAAIKNSGFEFPLERVLIDLSPADIKKEGSSFDLAIALSVLKAKDVVDGKLDPNEEDYLVLGELELSGNVRPVRAVRAAVESAKEVGVTNVIVSTQNKDEAYACGGVNVFSVDTLTEAYDAINGNLDASNAEDCTKSNGVEFNEITPDFEFGDVIGLNRPIEALTLAVAGKHNILLHGAPGCGKTLISQMVPGIIPRLTSNEAQSVTRIHSIAGLIQKGESTIYTPPFRSPHQTATIEGMCGGGPNCRPGEVSLSHNGVLFLDEASEFRTSTLQMLRVPIETGRMTLSRAGRSTVYPANFQLIMATNPCPCGSFGTKLRPCICSPLSIERYWKKFSGPLLDRISIIVSVDKDEKDDKRTTTEECRKKVASAYKMQRARGIYNERLSPAEIELHCLSKLTKDAKEFYYEVCQEKELSPRRSAQLLKLSRTVADIDEREEIEKADVEKALSFLGSTPLPIGD